MPEQLTFYYYDQFGIPCAAKTIVEDNVWVGGKPSRLLEEHQITFEEYALDLNTLKRLYPHG
jgi:hypothetical protein